MEEMLSAEASDATKVSKPTREAPYLSPGRKQLAYRKIHYLDVRGGVVKHEAAELILTSN